MSVNFHDVILTNDRNGKLKTCLGECETSCTSYSEPIVDREFVLKATDQEDKRERYPSNAHSDMLAFRLSGLDFLKLKRLKPSNQVRNVLTKNRVHSRVVAALELRMSS